MNDFADLEIDAEIIEEQDAGIWLSIGDLMSGLLMFFALLFITVMVQLRQYQEAFDKLPLVVLNAIETGIGGNDIVTVDSETGDVSIRDRILFDEGSDKLRPEGKLFLQKFIPIYSEVIFANDLFDRQIARVVIEGHTSSKGREQKNMELSLRRALSVADYIFSDEVNFPTKSRFKKKILAAGRGELDADTTRDRAGDRKVVFRFQFRRQDFSNLL